MLCFPDDTLEPVLHKKEYLQQWYMKMGLYKGRHMQTPTKCCRTLCPTDAWEQTRPVFNTVHAERRHLTGFPWTIPVLFLVTKSSSYITTSLQVAERVGAGLLGLCCCWRLASSELSRGIYSNVCPWLCLHSAFVSWLFHFLYSFSIWPLDGLTLVCALVFLIWCIQPKDWVSE